VLDSFDPFYDPMLKERNLEQLREVGQFSLSRVDIRDRQALESVFEATRPRVVIHLAALAGVRPSLDDPVRYSDVNVGGTAGLLELAGRYEVGNFVFGSSSSIYGDRTPAPFSEDDPAACPISPYAATKRAAELLCHSYHHNTGRPVSCLRFFTVYGPRQRPEMAINKFSRMILRGEKLPVFHEGQSQRDYTYVADIVQGVLAAAEKPLDFDIINLGNSEPIRLLDLIGLLESKLGRKAQLELMPAQPGDVPLTCADIARARRLLAYSPATTLDAGLDRFVSWLEKLRQ